MMHVYIPSSLFHPASNPPSVFDIVVAQHKLLR